MKYRFLSNVLHMYLGTTVEIILAIIATAVYVRTIGMAGYALLGIIISFITFFKSFDVPYFLALLKNRDKTKKQHFYFNLLYSSILAGNSIAATLLGFIAYILSKVAYKNTELLPLFTIAIATFLFFRTNRFLRTVLRIQGKEHIIQRFKVATISIEFILTLVLLFHFTLGVYAIILGTFLKNVVEYLLLTNYLKKIHSYYWNLEKKDLLQIARIDISKNFSANVLSSIFLYGSFFLSSFFLSPTLFGIFTLFTYFENKIRQVYTPLLTHFPILYSSLLHNQKIDRMKKMLQNTQSLSLYIFTAILFFLSIFGEKLYSFYFGEQLAGTYHLFVAYFVIVLLSLSFIPLYRYLFVTDIAHNIKILSLQLVTFLILFFPLVNRYSLTGVIIAYSASILLRIIVSIICTRNLLNVSIIFYASATLAIVTVFLADIVNLWILIVIYCVLISFFVMQCKLILQYIRQIIQNL